VVLGGITAIIVGSLAIPPLLWLGLALDTALLAVAWIDARRAASIVIRAERAWPPLLTQGARADVRLKLDGCPDRDIEVRLREGLHPGLAEAPLRLHARLQAGAVRVWTLELRPRLRGRHTVAPLVARVLGPWGLAWAQRELLPAETRQVYPQVRWEGRAGRLLMLAHRHQLGQLSTSVGGESSEPYALREYLPGDPLRTIHWKATARHGRPITREEVLQAGARLVILLDCGRSMTTSCNGRSKLDHSLAAALALARVASARGDRVTIAAFADRMLRVVRVASSGRGLRQAYSRLFDLEARLVEPAYDVALQALPRIEPRRSTVVLLTSVADLAAAELLRDTLLQLELRHRPLLVNLEDEGIAGLARGIPEAVDEAFAKTSALQIVLANRLLARRLRRSGVRVVATPADRMTLATLDAYLAFAHRRHRPA